MLRSGIYHISSFAISFAAMLVFRFGLKVPGVEWPEPRLDFPISSSLPPPEDEIQV